MLRRLTFENFRCERFYADIHHWHKVSFPLSLFLSLQTSTFSFCIKTLGLLQEKVASIFSTLLNNRFSLTLFSETAVPFWMKLPEIFLPQADTWHGKFQPKHLRFGKEICSWKQALQWEMLGNFIKKQNYQPHPSTNPNQCVKLYEKILSLNEWSPCISKDQK